ncbi:MAG: hypothetical protein N2116_02595 [Armatimonadetes bacterium]|nr:hypothetical protein [Armatimonadota bacterium]
MRLYVAVDNQKFKFVGNMAKTFQQLTETVSEGQSVRVLTIFYDSKKEKRRFKRELREAGGNLLKAAQNYLNWWNTIHQRRQRRLEKLQAKRPG